MRTDKLATNIVVSLSVHKTSAALFSPFIMEGENSDSGIAQPATERNAMIRTEAESVTSKDFFNLLDEKFGILLIPAPMHQLQ